MKECLGSESDARGVLLDVHWSAGVCECVLLPAVLQLVHWSACVCVCVCARTCARAHLLGWRLAAGGIIRLAGGA